MNDQIIILLLSDCQNSLTVLSVTTNGYIPNSVILIMHIVIHSQTIYTCLTT